MTKRIVSGIFILTALGALGVILAGALTSGEQLIVRFLTAVIVAALGLYVISDLRLQADDEAVSTRAGGQTRVGTVDAPPNSTAAFMATVTRKTDGPPTDMAAATSDMVSRDGPIAANHEPLAPDEWEVPAPDAWKVEVADAEEHVGAAVSDAGAPGRFEAEVSPAKSEEPVHEQEGLTEGELVEAVAGAEAEVADESDRNSDHALASVGAPASSASDLAAAGSVPHYSNRSGHDRLNGHRAPDTVRQDFLNGPSVDISDLFVDHISPTVPDTPVSDGTISDQENSGTDSSAPWSVPIDNGHQSSEFDSWPGQDVDSNGVAYGKASDAAEGPGNDQVDAGVAGEDSTNVVEGKTATGPAAFEYSDELVSTEYAWPAVPVNCAPEPHPFEKASAAYEAAKRKIEHVDELPSPTSLPAAAPSELDVMSYADAPIAPIIDLREISGTGPDEVDNAIHVGEVEVIATLIEQGMLNTAGPISDREVRTMVYVAFTSNELRKLLIAGGSPDGPNYGLDLGPVELFDERRHTPAPKTLYSGIDHPQPTTQLG